MTSPRSMRWFSFSGLAGGLVMFAIEAALVLVLGVTAWILSALVLAL